MAPFGAYGNIEESLLCPYCACDLCPFDDRDERFLVLSLGIADRLGWYVRHLFSPPWALV